MYILYVYYVYIIYYVHISSYKRRNVLHNALETFDIRFNKYLNDSYHLIRMTSQMNYLLKM